MPDLNFYTGTDFTVHRFELYKSETIEKYEKIMRDPHMCTQLSLD